MDGIELELWKRQVVGLTKKNFQIRLAQPLKTLGPIPVLILGASAFRAGTTRVSCVLGACLGLNLVTQARLVEDLTDDFVGGKLESMRMMGLRDSAYYASLLLTWVLDIAMVLGVVIASVSCYHDLPKKMDLYITLLASSLAIGPFVMVECRCASNKQMAQCIVGLGFLLCLFPHLWTTDPLNRGSFFDDCDAKFKVLFLFIPPVHFAAMMIAQLANARADPARDGAWYLYEN